MMIFISSFIISIVIYMLIVEMIMNSDLFYYIMMELHLGNENIPIYSTLLFLVLWGVVFMQF